MKNKKWSSDIDILENMHVFGIEPSDVDIEHFW